MYRAASRDAVLIVCAAAVLGFSYTFLTGKGLFLPRKAAVSASTGSPAPSSINLTESRKLFESGTAIFIDSRHLFEFRIGHIKSAINIPLSELDAHAAIINALPKDKVLIVYCDGSDCNSSIELAAKLYERGFGGVRIFFGGWQEWNSQKLPLEAGE